MASKDRCGSKPAGQKSQPSLMMLLIITQANMFKTGTNDWTQIINFLIFLFLYWLYELGKQKSNSFITKQWRSFDANDIWLFVFKMIAQVTYLGTLWNIWLNNLFYFAFLLHCQYYLKDKASALMTTHACFRAWYVPKTITDFS